MVEEGVVRRQDSRQRDVTLSSVTLGSASSSVK